MGNPTDEERGTGNSKRGTENSLGEILAGKPKKSNTLAQQARGKHHRQVSPSDRLSTTNTTVENEASLGYKKGEIKQSRSETGFLNRDVYEGHRGIDTFLYIVDFGIGKSDIKSSTKDDQLLKQWLKRFAKGGSTYELKIEASTDNVGEENKNIALRQRRAQSFLELLDSSTRSRAAVHTSPTHLYIYPTNDTPKARARNRGVVVKVSPEVQEGEIIRGPDRTWNQICYHALSIWKKRNRSPHYRHLNRSMEGSLRMLCNSDVDDRYFNGYDWMYDGRTKLKTETIKTEKGKTLKLCIYRSPKTGNVVAIPPKQIKWYHYPCKTTRVVAPTRRLRDDIRNAVNPNVSDEENLKLLEQIALEINAGIAYAQSTSETLIGIEGTPRCHLEILFYIMASMQHRPKSIYYPWKGVNAGRSSRVLYYNTPCNGPGARGKGMRDR